MSKFIIATSGEEVATLPSDDLLLLTPEGSEIAPSAPHLGNFAAIFVYSNANELISHVQAQQAIAKSISALHTYIVADHVKSCQEKSKQLSSKLNGSSINAEEIISSVRVICFIDFEFSKQQNAKLLSNNSFFSFVHSF